MFWPKNYRSGILLGHVFILGYFYSRPIPNVVVSLVLPAVRALDWPMRKRLAASTPKVVAVIALLVQRRAVAVVFSPDP